MLKIFIFFQFADVYAYATSYWYLYVCKSCMKMVLNFIFFFFSKLQQTNFKISLDSFEWSF